MIFSQRLILAGASISKASEMSGISLMILSLFCPPHNGEQSPRLAHFYSVAVVAIQIATRAGSTIVHLAGRNSSLHAIRNNLRSKIDFINGRTNTGSELDDQIRCIRS